MNLNVEGGHVGSEFFQYLVVVGGMDGFSLGSGFKQFLDERLPFLASFGCVGRVSGGGGAFANNGGFQIFYGLGHRN